MGYMQKSFGAGCEWLGGDGWVIRARNNVGERSCHVQLGFGKGFLLPLPIHAALQFSSLYCIGFVCDEVTGRLDNCGSEVIKVTSSCVQCSAVQCGQLSSLSGVKQARWTVKQVSIDAAHCTALHCNTASSQP